MKRIIPNFLWALMVIFCGALVTGCAAQKTTIGNGVLDENEAGWVKVAAGVYMTARPESVMPIYLVTEAVLKKDITAAMADDIRAVLREEAAGLGLISGDVQVLLEAADAIKADLMARITLPEALTGSERIAILRKVLTVINSAAAARARVAVA